ncbi:MAG: metallophosphoesterase [Methanotrichaceae archaeon]
MTRIVALSDTHLEEGLPETLVKALAGADIIFHAGDFVSPKVYKSLTDLGRVVAVCGNADSPELKRLLPVRLVVEVGRVKIGLIHMASHSTDLTGADMMAREMGVKVLIFGHIHRPIIESGKTLLICPGSPTVPRMSVPTIAELEIDGDNIRGNIIPVGAPVCDYLKFAASLPSDHGYYDSYKRKD